jgi:hypothetical protein
VQFSFFDPGTVADFFLKIGFIAGKKLIFEKFHPHSQGLLNYLMHDPELYRKG